MGEAKHRKATDASYGRPKRGLVMSPPIEINGSELVVKASNIDKQELRYALLFWDKIVWPSSHAVYLQSNRDEVFLEEAGVLRRPNYTVVGDIARGIMLGQIQAFMDLDKKEPGQWSLSQGKNTLLLKDSTFQAVRGASIELFRAIPVPDRDVPLNEILEFKLKRRDELFHLQSQIDNFLLAIEQAEDKIGELNRSIKQVDAACADLLKVGKDWKFPIRLSNWKVSFELRPFPLIFAAISGWDIAGIGMPLTTAVVGASSLKISADISLQPSNKRQNPYLYVHQFHKEVF
jgi:hypothetical protein